MDEAISRPFMGGAVDPQVGGIRQEFRV